MHRYLLNISYIGTRFQGMQKIFCKANPVKCDRTVQGVLESALLQFEPKNFVKVVLSSRTDAGVHAIQSTVQVDLEQWSGQPYCEERITSGLNKTFYKTNQQIRVLRTERVPNTFNCRYCVKSRTYLYRFAVAKRVPEGYSQPMTFARKYIPIEEIDRCHFVFANPFDVELAIEASKLFIGLHDFRTFMSTSKLRNRDHPFFGLRTIYDCTLRPGKPLTTDITKATALNDYDYWEFKVCGRSFLYNQIRRMVGTLFAVAQHRITIKDVYEMLTIPSPNSWCPRSIVAPSCGLFLVEVKYDEKDKKFPEDSVVQIQSDEL